MSENPVILNIQPDSDYRIVAISDIHGGLDLFKQLLEQVGLREEDYLVLVGDLIEKGPKSAEMLDYARQLSKRKNTVILSGNFEKYISGMLLCEEDAEELLEYIQEVPYPTLFTTWCEKLELDIAKVKDAKALQAQLVDSYKEEIAFLDALPVALEIDAFIFVHAGIEPIEDWKASDLWVMLRSRAFLSQTHQNSKYVVVGHWPTVNYRPQSLTGEVLMDHEAKILCIDGGYGVKDHGQLNALIIDKKDGIYQFSTRFADDFVPYQAIASQHVENQKVVKVDWQDNAISVLEKKKEFSLCKKISTGELVYIKNELIETREEACICCNDYVSLFLTLEKGDRVGVIDFYGEYALAKHNEALGWVHKNILERI